VRAVVERAAVDRAVHVHRRRRAVVERAAVDRAVMDRAAEDRAADTMAATDESAVPTTVHTRLRLHAVAHAR
jgi:hypothetical protein